MSGHPGTGGLRLLRSVGSAIVQHPTQRNPSRLRPAASAMSEIPQGPVAAHRFKVIIVGGGFGDLECAKALAGADCDVLLGCVTIGKTTMAAESVLWAAGVRASPAARWLCAPSDRAGSVIVGPDLTLPSDAPVYVIGDTGSLMHEGKMVPGVAPAAKQMGRYVGDRLRQRIEGETIATAPFRYRHQEDLATVGRGSAVVKLGRLELTGWFGWLFWSVAHVYFLIGFRNRIAVAFSWTWDYLTTGRKARLILEHFRSPAE